MKKQILLSLVLLISCPNVTASAKKKSAHPSLIAKGVTCLFLVAMAARAKGQNVDMAQIKDVYQDQMVYCWKHKVRSDAGAPEGSVFAEIKYNQLDPTEEPAFFVKYDQKEATGNGISVTGIGDISGGTVIVGGSITNIGSMTTTRVNNGKVITKEVKKSNAFDRSKLEKDVKEDMYKNKKHFEKLFNCPEKGQDYQAEYEVDEDGSLRLRWLGLSTEYWDTEDGWCEGLKKATKNVKCDSYDARTGVCLYKKNVFKNSKHDSCLRNQCMTGYNNFLQKNYKNRGGRKR